MAIFNEPAQWDHVLGSKADVRPLPDDTSATTGLASLQKLFQMINQIPLDVGGVAPGRLDFNALFKLLGDSIFYAMNGGLASYNQAYDYPPNRVVVYGNGLYKCIRANGPSASVVVPGTNDAVWQKIPTTSDVSDLIPIATTLIKGIVQLCDNIDANASDNSKALTPYAVARQNYVKSVNSVRADAYGNVSITRVNSAASADSAARAAQDITGQQINTTYIKSLAINGRTITYTKGNGATGTLTTQDTTYSRLSQFQNDVGYITSAGSCAYATKAAQDSSGQQIDTTYVKSLSINGATITYTKGNGATGTITTYSKLSQFQNDVGYITSAGSCAYATKAAQDSLGQQIDTTYLKALTLNGQTLTYTKGNGATGGVDLTALSKVSLLSDRFGDGTWTLSGVVVGKPIFITHNAGATPGGAALQSVSGTSDMVTVHGFGTWFGLYVGYIYGGACAIIIPTSSTVVINVTNSSDDGDHFRAYQ